MWVKDIFDIFPELQSVSYLYLFWLILIFCLWCHINLSNFAWTPSFLSCYNPVLYLYINLIVMYFVKAQLCKNDYFSPNSFAAKGDNFSFPCYLARTTDEVYHSLCISSRGEFLGIWRSNFLIFWSTWRSTMREQCMSIAALKLVTLGIDILKFCR